MVNFAAQLQPRLLVPMHLAFGNASRTTRAFAGRTKELGITTCVIERQGQEINYSGRMV